MSLFGGFRSAQIDTESIVGNLPQCHFTLVSGISRLPIVGFSISCSLVYFIALLGLYFTPSSFPDRRRKFVEQGCWAIFLCFRSTIIFPAVFYAGITDRLCNKIFVLRRILTVLPGTSKLSPLRPGSVLASFAVILPRLLNATASSTNFFSFTGLLMFPLLVLQSSLQIWIASDHLRQRRY